MHFKDTHLGGSTVGVGWRGERGQEIRIRVINNFCSVINHRHSTPLPPTYTSVFMSSSIVSFTTVFSHPNCSLDLRVRLIFLNVVVALKFNPIRGEFMIKKKNVICVVLIKLQFESADVGWLVGKKKSAEIVF